MPLRLALLLLVASLSVGCVSSGSDSPLQTGKGCDEARAAYVQLGLGYLRQGLSEQAKVPLQKALALDNQDADANAALALVFQAQAEPELADQYYQKALAVRPHDPRLLNNYGSFLYQQERYEQAAGYFQQAATDTLYPERSRVFENLGVTSVRLGQRESARRQLEKALHLNQRQPRALLEMAQLSFEDRHYVPARDYYERFSLLSGQNARSLLLGVRLATVHEERDKAARFGQQLERLYPGTPEYQQYLSEQ
ncbi:type IV pilus biogenesis/stability protein PilW [Pseudomonas brenneri]|uniref:type IV pilus biogenesis/stability protein PilW n=1 Tax=Pseudomonas brenneri TaxID=129817 RepID=UPI003570EA35